MTDIKTACKGAFPGNVNKCVASKDAEKIIAGVNIHCMQVGSNCTEDTYVKALQGKGVTSWKHPSGQTVSLKPSQAALQKEVGKVGGGPVTIDVTPKPEAKEDAPAAKADEKGDKDAFKPHEGVSLGFTATIPFRTSMSLMQNENPGFSSSIFSSKAVPMSGLAGIRITPFVEYEFSLGKARLAWPIHIQNFWGKVTVPGIMGQTSTDEGSMLTLTTGPEIAFLFRAYKELFIGPAVAGEFISDVLSADVPVGVSTAGSDYDPSDDLDIGDYFSITARLLLEYAVDLGKDFYLPLTLSLGYVYTNYQHNGGGLTMPFTVELVEGEHALFFDIGLGVLYKF